MAVDHQKEFLAAEGAVAVGEAAAVVEGLILGVTDVRLAGGTVVNSVTLPEGSAPSRLCGKVFSPRVLFAASRTSC